MKYLMMAALAAVVALAVACGDDDNATQTPATATQATSATSTTQATATASPTATATVANTATATPLANVCQTNPNPATPAQTVVDAPLSGAQVTSPVTVSGQIAAFEAQFNIAIKDASGADIASQPGHSQEGQTLSPFSESVPFTVTTQTPACLWVFDISNADGVTPTQVVQVPITLAP
jgi:cytoskeletal protein RodZ